MRVVSSGRAALAVGAAIAVTCGVLALTSAGREERGVVEFFKRLFMGGTKLAVSCAAVNEVNPRGERIPIRVEIFNRSDEEVALRSVGVPWEAFYAIEFEVKNRPDFRKFYREGLPLDLPSTQIPAGGSAAGVVYLEDYVGGPNDEQINKLPGDYVVEALVKTFVIKEQGDDEMLKLRSEPFNVRIVEGR